METDNNNKTPALNFSNELNIESIISAPLIAASKANVMMLSGQLGFLLEYCFEKQGDAYTPRMVNMEMSHHEFNADGTPKIDTLYFQVPLLCLLPLNSIAVDNVKVNFDLEVTSIGSYQSSSSLFEKRAVINGKIAPSKNTNTEGNDYEKRSDTARLDVEINVGKLPLPKGVLSILDLYTKNINPVSLKSK